MDRRLNYPGVRLLKREPPPKLEELVIVDGMGKLKSSPRAIEKTRSRTSATLESDESETSKSPEKAYYYVPDWQKDSDDALDDVIALSVGDQVINPDQITAEQSKHQSIWKPTLLGKPRRVTHGDLKYDLGQRVIAILPFYVETNSNTDAGDREIKVVPLKLVVGEIVDIHFVNANELDVPREIRIRTTPEKNVSGEKWKQTSRSCIDSAPEWVKLLIAESLSENRDFTVQTMVVSYTLKLDKEFILNRTEIEVLSNYVQEHGYLPYNYDLEFQESNPPPNQGRRKKQQTKNPVYDLITVRYRYIMDTEVNCKKALYDLKKIDIARCTLADLSLPLKKINLHGGIAVNYSDINPLSTALIRSCRFLIQDHICVGPYDFRFVMRALDPCDKILAIVPLNNFDIRNDYPVSRLYCFHPLDRYVYQPVKESCTVDQIRSTLTSIFSALKIYIVKNSLCSPDDIESSVYEDRDGTSKILPGKPQISRSSPGKSTASSSLRYSGISLASYVKGLAYPEGPIPEYNSYIFFHSKDYYSLVVDPNSPNFLDLIPAPEGTLMFRNPLPKDVLLALPFVCDREPFKGKTNLRWFYPKDETRLLHLYITTGGRHPHFQPLLSGSSKNRRQTPSKSEATVRKQFTGEHLHLLDLFIYGLSPENPSLSSITTKRFLQKYFWWELLKLEAREALEGGD